VTEGVDLFGRLFARRAEAGASVPPERRTLAVIWATVDRDRALADLGLQAERLADDPLLGASVGLVKPPHGDPVAIVEPSTEGRLAAALARDGEGPIGLYVESPVALDAVAALAASAGLQAGRIAAGPFGASVLVVAERIGGPHLVLVERPAGTIDR
jgi:hypothetical protein